MSPVFTRRSTRRPSLSECPEAHAVRGVALLLPGGTPRSHRPPSRIAEWAMLPLRASLAENERTNMIAVHVLHYRFRGWNGAEASARSDAEWALGELEQRYGDVPVCLIGNSMGGRAAFEVSGHPNVVAVAGVAPWVPSDTQIQQLAGRKVMIVHGDRDRSRAGAENSLNYAQRARAAGHQVCRFEVAGAGHLLLSRARDFWMLTSEFVGDVLNDKPFGPMIADAFTSPEGLRVPVPVGYPDGTR